MSSSRVDLELMIRDQAASIKALDIRVKTLETLMDTHNHQYRQPSFVKYPTSNRLGGGDLYG